MYHSALVARVAIGRRFFTDNSRLTSSSSYSCHSRRFWVKLCKTVLLAGTIRLSDAPHAQGNRTWYCVELRVSLTKVIGMSKEADRLCARSDL
jgi:hypothetical protein